MVRFADALSPGDCGAVPACASVHTGATSCIIGGEALHCYCIDRQEQLDVILSSGMGHIETARECLRRACFRQVVMPCAVLNHCRLLHAIAGQESTTKLC